MSSVPTVEFALLVGRAVFLVFSFVLAAATFSAWRRAALRQSEQALTQSDAMLKRLDALDARLHAARSAISSLADSIEHSARTGAAGNATLGYQIAIRLARGGASPEELVQSCGLSRSEAELVRRLHGATTPASA